MGGQIQVRPALMAGVGVRRLMQGLRCIPLMLEERVRNELATGYRSRTFDSLNPPSLDLARWGQHPRCSNVMVIL